MNDPRLEPTGTRDTIMNQPSLNFISLARKKKKKKGNNPSFLHQSKVMATLPSPPTTPPPIPPRFIIRPAIDSDLPSILEIYNRQIIETNAFFWLQPSTLKDRHAWLDHLRANEYPVIVAVENNETGAGMIAGCCALAPLGNRSKR